MKNIDEKLNSIAEVTIGRLSSITFDSAKDIVKSIENVNEHFIPLLNALLKDKVVSSRIDILKMVLAFLIVEMVEHGRFSDDKKSETVNEQVN